MTIKNAKQCLREEVIPTLRERSSYFDVASIKHLLTERGVHVERGTLSRYVYELGSESQIYNAGRGWYSAIEQEFRLDSEPVAEIISTLEKEFPLLDFFCWSTQQINPFMHHLLAKFVTFIHVDRDLMASVFDFFKDAGYDAYLNPTRREAQKSFSVGEKTVVVRPNVTKAPVDGHLARIEKILVDLRVELESLLLMDVGEFQEMSQRAVTSQRIEISSLMSYAKRRKLDWKGLFRDPDSIISTIAQERS